MKILCPIDFSDTSINAARWAFAYLEQLGGGTLEFLHCVSIRSRSGMFLKMDDVLKEWAERDMRELVTSFAAQSAEVKLHAKIVVLDPKSYIPQYAAKQAFDMITIGTEGLSAVKDITVGSVTEYLINKSSLPVLVVPPNCEMTNLKNIVFGVDRDSAKDQDATAQIIALCKRNDAFLRVVHFKKEHTSSKITAPTVLEETKGLGWLYEEVDVFGDLVGAFNTYCRKHKADMLCLVHHRRNWWSRVFKKSLTKSELFKLEVPLLVLSQAY